jgi:hypothetical protein
MKGKNVLLKLGLLLLLRASPCLGHRRVGGAVEDMLPIKGALAQRSPTLGVVLVHVFWVDRRGGDVVLKSAEVREDLGNSPGAVFIDYRGRPIVSIRGR